MNFFEGQFRKMLWGNDMIRTPFYVDGACFGTLDRDRLVQMQFLASKNGYLFDVLEIVVVRRASGQQNTFDLQLKDILGARPFLVEFPEMLLPIGLMLIIGSSTISHGRTGIGSRTL